MTWLRQALDIAEELVEGEEHPAHALEAYAMATTGPEVTEDGMCAHADIQVTPTYAKPGDWLPNGWDNLGVCFGCGEYMVTTKVGSVPDDGRVANDGTWTMEHPEHATKLEPTWSGAWVDLAQTLWAACPTDEDADSILRMAVRAAEDQ